jgi:hypothetical protein
MDASDAITGAKSLLRQTLGVYSPASLELVSWLMPRFRKSVPLISLVSTPVEIYEVDRVPLSAEEVNLAKLLIDKLVKSEKNRPTDFRLASKWKVRQPRPTKN